MTQFSNHYRRQFMQFLFLVISVLGLAACDIVSLTSGSISIDHSPSYTITAGNGASLVISIGRDNYEGPVDVELTGLPSGMRSSATSTSNDSVALTVSTAVDMTARTYTLTLVASGNGIADVSSDISIKVNPPPNNVITVSAEIWGLVFTIPQAAMEDFTTAGDVVTAFMALGGAAIAATGGAAAPFVALAAAYFALEFVAIKAINQGKGVYLTMLWVTPGIFVPTPI